MTAPRPAGARPGWRLYPRARDGLGAVLDALGLKEGRGRVLLPAYVGWSSREGSGIYDPIARRALGVDFYRVAPDLTVDAADFERAAGEVRGPSAALVVHYFGRPDPSLGRLAACARARGIALIEDAAHAYLSAEHARSCGGEGVAVLYSLHKMFAVPEGGALVLRDAGLEASVPEGEAGRSPSWAAALEADLGAHAAARLRNYAELQGLLAPLAGALRPLWSALPAGTVPHSFPVLVRDAALRDRLYFGLKARGFVVASLYHALIEPIREERFPASFALSRSMFNLPVSPWTSGRELESLGRELAALARG